MPSIHRAPRSRSLDAWPENGPDRDSHWRPSSSSKGHYSVQFGLRMQRPVVAGFVVAWHPTCHPPAAGACVEVSLTLGAPLLRKTVSLPQRFRLVPTGKMLGGASRQAGRSWWDETRQRRGGVRGGEGGGGWRLLDTGGGLRHALTGGCPSTSVVVPRAGTTVCSAGRADIASWGSHKPS